MVMETIYSIHFPYSVSSTQALDSSESRNRA